MNQSFLSASSTLFGDWQNVHEALVHGEGFQSRLKVIKDWFETWNEQQRCKLLILLFQQCGTQELDFIRGWFLQQKPVLRQDFTSVLPRHLSLYLFSFLDARTLCHCSQVSWHWHFLCEQDQIWISKCIRLGWYMSYIPSSKEYGGWKSQYIRSVEALCIFPGSLDIYSCHETFQPEHKETEKKVKITIEELKEEKKSNYHPKRKLLQKRVLHPTWLPPDKEPRILEKDALRLFGPHPQESFKSSMKLEKHYRARTEPWSSLYFSNGRRIATDSDLSDDIKFSKDLKLFPSIPGCLQLGDATLAFPLKNANTGSRLLEHRKSIVDGRKKLALSGHWHALYEARTRNMIASAQNFPGMLNPRVLFLSSKMPAREILYECVTYGVICIPYDYEGSTLDGLLTELKFRLGGRLAQCIGFMAEGGCCHEKLNLVRSFQLSVSTVSDERMVSFWKTLAVCVCAGGVVDIFWPLSTTETGLKIIDELSHLAGVSFSTPIGLSGSYTRMETPWLKDGAADVPTPLKYFNEAKVHSWMNYCFYVDEALAACRGVMSRLLHHDYMLHTDRLIGRLVYDLSKFAALSALEGLGKALKEAAMSLEEESEGKSSGMIDELTEKLHAISRSEKGNRPKLAFKKKEDLSWIERSVEARYQCVKEMLEVESDYQEKLGMLLRLYRDPLVEYLHCSRPIISQANVRIIFSDAAVLLDLVTELLVALRARADNWKADQCIGDIYLRLSANLKAYSNYMKNYSTVLLTYQRCFEENPLFKAFLNRAKMNRRSMQLTIPELLIAPTEIMKKRANLLSTLKRFTAEDHKDYGLLSSAYNKIYEIATTFEQHRLRVSRNDKIKELQTIVEGCPVLEDVGRYFVKEMHFQLLSPPKQTGSCTADKEVYLPAAEIVVYLLSDTLLVARNFLKLLPYSRCSAYSCRFESAVDLLSVVVEDIPDTKSYEHALLIRSDKYGLLLRARDEVEKRSHLSTFAETIASLLPRGS